MTTEPTEERRWIKIRVDIDVPIEHLNCPHCGEPHTDINEWATRPHKTHLCNYCNKEFEGTMKAVSRPTIMHTLYEGLVNAEMGTIE